MGSAADAAALKGKVEQREGRQSGGGWKAKLTCDKRK